jgi:hypothetical protein
VNFATWECAGVSMYAERSTWTYNALLRTTDERGLRGALCAGTLLERPVFWWFYYSGTESLTLSVYGKTPCATLIC